ncbi:MAG: fructosamine kinase family protein [Crocinitomicaceae bacterium]
MTNHQALILDIYPDAEEITTLSGGDINAVYTFRQKGEKNVIKINKKEDFPEMFRKESNGLQALAKSIAIPKGLEDGVQGEWQYLTMKFVESREKTSAFWSAFGEKLANLHQCSAEYFGWKENNYIGSLVQSNQSKSRWVDFLIEERLQPMIEMAVNAGDVNYVESRIMEPFYKRLNELFPAEKPALLHGDLWGGNYLCDKNEHPVLIDPAVYYGHREMDIAMMHLFGGFDPALFEAYNAHFPMEKGWKKRIPYGQVYPLLVHVNLFGRSYWERVHNILAKIA